MTHNWTLSLAGVPPFLEYFSTAIGLLAAFAFLYTRVTPHDELALIRQGKAAAAVALGGSLLGFVLPEACAIIHAVTLLDFAIWAAIALVIQLAAWFLVRLVVPDLSRRIESDEMATAVLIATVSLAVGLINAACMTP
jgi:putative membrane protein